MAQRFALGPDQVPERIDRVLAELMPENSRSTVQRWIEEGLVRLNGRLCRARDRVRPGAVIDVEPGPPLPSRADPDPSIRFPVLFEDDHLIVIDKPPGLVVHPSRGHARGTLVNGLLARAGFASAPYDPRDPVGPLRPGVVHRIDKDTSGVLVVTKDQQTREGIKAQLSSHSVERVYTAVTVGVPPTTTLSTMHERHRHSRLRYTSRTRHGRPAVTHIKVVEALAGGLAGLIECRLETGRTHQIRVHLAEQTGTPVLADRLYGKKSPEPAVNEVAARLGRQALHAGVLGFTHPVTGEPLRFEAPLPADMAGALAELRALCASRPTP